jgi:glycosyltransferase involved in cell wall biosynthesis
MAEAARILSVVILTYRCAQYLPEAIESVLAQTYRDFEIIVVDDGSTDNTQEVLARYGDQIRVIRQSNQGSAAARNAGILTARGEYIAFLDADDVWLPKKLEKQVSLIEERPEVGWVYSDHRQFDESGLRASSFFEQNGLRPPPEGWILRKLVWDCITSTITVLARASCFREVGLFHTSLPRGQDYDMWLRLAGRFPVGCLDEVLALYREHSAQVTSRTRSGLIEYHTWRVLRKFALGRYRGLPPEVRREARAILRWRMAEYASRVGEVALAGGHRGAARRWLLRSAAANPRMPTWRVGLLLDAMLPPGVMRWLRRLKHRLAAGPRMPPRVISAARGAKRVLARSRGEGAGPATTSAHPCDAASGAGIT